jgi:hypothetical protein
MKLQVFILAIFSGLIASCNFNNTSSITETGSNTTSQLLSESERLEELKNQKMIIDSVFSHRKDSLMVWAKPAGSSDLIQVKNGNSPARVEITYYVLKDSSGRIILTSSIPFSESGDWNISLTHYFDTEGKTFAFERKANFYNSICTEGVAIEKQTEFFDTGFQVIDKLYKLVDEKGQVLQKDSCQFPYNYAYKVSENIDKYLATHGIPGKR